MLQAIRRVLGRRRADGFYECRRCGTTVDRPRGCCPTCDSSEIACYEV